MFVDADSLKIKVGPFFSCWCSQQLIWFIPASSAKQPTIWSVTLLYTLLAAIIFYKKNISRTSLKSPEIPNMPTMRIPQSFVNKILPLFFIVNSPIDIIGEIFPLNDFTFFPSFKHTYFFYVSTFFDYVCTYYFTGM